MNLSHVKQEIRVVGFDDAPFAFSDKYTMVIGAVFRGGLWMDGVITTRIEVDGSDSSERIASAVNGSPHREQLRVIMLDGVTFGGFNIVDMKRLNKETGIPVIAVVRDKPDFAAIRKALSRFDDSEKRWMVMKKAGPLKSVDIEDPKDGKLKSIWFQTSGIDEETARDVIRVSSTRSLIPEPLRVAHLIGQGIENGRE